MLLTLLYYCKLNIFGFWTFEDDTLGSGKYFSQFSDILSNCKWKESLSVCPLCPSIISVPTTVHPIDFTLGGCIAEDPRKCSVECEVVCLASSIASCSFLKNRSSNWPIPSFFLFTPNCLFLCICFTCTNKLKQSLTCVDGLLHVNGTVRAQHLFVVGQTGIDLKVGEPNPQERRHGCKFLLVDLRANIQTTSRKPCDDAVFVKQFQEMRFLRFWRQLRCRCQPPFLHRSTHRLALFLQRKERLAGEQEAEEEVCCFPPLTLETT